MEHRLAAGVRKADALLSALGKRRELGHRRQHLGEGATGLLDLPLGVKIPVLPGSKPVFSRAKLGEKLHRPSCSFDLGDPYCRLMRTEYNSLHDPHLQAYHNRQDNIRRLKRAGYVTSDGQVVCTLKEFNEYRQYLTTLKVEAEKMFRREEGWLKTGGYLLPSDSQMSALHSGEAVQSAVATMQQFYGIPVTGVLDQTTIE
ncbi:fibrous sheath-interacting protein 2-like isoform 3-T6 [Phoenicopterus ruber ruber]